MKKLVEELAQEMAFCWNEEGGLVRDREKARFYIDRIGKAYAIGEIDLPSEVARTWSMEDDHLFAWMKGWIAQGVRSYIALRKEEKE